MRILTLLLICTFCFNAAFAQAYLEPMSKLKVYLQTGKNLFVKDIEVKDGDFYIYGTTGTYYKINLKKMGETVGIKTTNQVIMKCKDDANCVYSSNIKSKKSFVSFYAAEDSVRKDLPPLFNDFIISYDKELGITPPLIHDTNGCISGDCENGIGDFLYSDGSLYSGSWKNGKREGGGSLKKKDETRIYATWINDQCIGKGIIAYPNKNKYDGEIKDEQPNGKGVLFLYNWNYKEDTRLEGTFVNGKINGKGLYTNLILDTKYELMKETYVGDFKDSLYDGFGIYQLTSHFPKAQKRGLDDTVRYEGEWKNGKKDGTGHYLSNHIHEAEEYTGEWKNGLKNGKGICHYRTFDGDLKIGNMKDENTFDGIWLNGQESVGKLTSSSGNVLYNGGAKERDAYWKNVSIQQQKAEAAFDKDYKSRSKERQELAERNAANAKKECVCSKCGGSGKMSIKSAKIWKEDLYENGKKVGTATNSGWEYEDITCTRCLGTGKCK